MENLAAAACIVDDGDLLTRMIREVMLECILMREVFSYNFFSEITARYLYKGPLDL